MVQLCIYFYVIIIHNAILAQSFLAQEYAVVNVSQVLLKLQTKTHFDVGFIKIN